MVSFLDELRKESDVDTGAVFDEIRRQVTRAGESWATHILGGIKESVRRGEFSDRNGERRVEKECDLCGLGYSYGGRDDERRVFFNGKNIIEKVETNIECCYDRNIGERINKSYDLVHVRYDGTYNAELLVVETKNVEVAPVFGRKRIEQYFEIKKGCWFDTYIGALQGTLRKNGVDSRIYFVANELQLYGGSSYDKGNLYRTVYVHGTHRRYKKMEIQNGFTSLSLEYKPKEDSSVILWNFIIEVSCKF